MDQIGKGLKSPQGILAAVGLAFGAYEAYKATSGKQDEAAAAPPPVPASGAAPPPIPGAAAGPPPIPGAPPLPQPGTLAAENTAIRLIRAMIAAAHADGVLDERERDTIVNKVKKSGLGPDEEAFLMTELDHPKTIDELTAGLADPATKRMLFGLSVAAIVEDTEAARHELRVFGHDAPAIFARAGAEVNDPIGAAHGFLVVFHHQHGDGKFYLYFTLNNPAGGKLIGVSPRSAEGGPSA